MMAIQEMKDYTDQLMQTGTLEQKVEAVLCRFFAMDWVSELTVYNPACPTDDFAWPLKALVHEGLRPFMLPLKQTPKFTDSEKQKATGDKYITEPYSHGILGNDGIARNVPGMDDDFAQELRAAVKNIAGTEQKILRMTNPIVGARNDPGVESARIGFQKVSDEAAASIPLQVIRSTNREDIATVLKAFDLLADHIKTLGVSTGLDQDLTILREHTDAMIKKAWTRQSPEPRMFKGWTPQVFQGGMA